MSERKLGKDAADIQVRELLDYYNVEVGDCETEKEKELRTTIVESFVIILSPFFQRCQLSLSKVDGELSVVQHLRDKRSFTYKEMDGMARIETDKVKIPKKNTDSLEMFALMGYLSGNGLDVMSKLKGSDLSVLDALYSFFLHA